VELGGITIRVLVSQASRHLDHGDSVLTNGFLADTEDSEWSERMGDWTVS
jgi:hypothetical protein